MLSGRSSGNVRRCAGWQDMRLGPIVEGLGGLVCHVMEVELILDNLGARQGSVLGKE